MQTIPVSQAARELGVTADHVRFLIRTRKLRSQLSPGGHHEVDAESVREYDAARQSYRFGARTAA